MNEPGRRGAGCGIVAAALALGAAACGLSLVRVPGARVEIVETIRGAAPDAAPGEAIYDPGRDVPFVTVSPIATLMGPIHYDHRVPVEVRVDGESVSVTVPRALYSVRGERLTSLRVPGGVRLSFRGHPAEGPPPEDPTPTGGTNPVEYATVEGRVARYAGNAAFLPAVVAVGDVDVDRVEVEVDPSPVITSSFSTGHAKRVAAGQHLELPLEHASRSGFPSRSGPAPDGLRVSAVAVPDAEAGRLLGWWIRAARTPVTAAQRAALAAAADPRFAVSTDGHTVAIDVPADPPPGPTALLAWVESGDGLVGAAYAQLSVAP